MNFQTPVCSRVISDSEKHVVSELYGRMNFKFVNS